MDTQTIPHELYSTFHLVGLLLKPEHAQLVTSEQAVNIDFLPALAQGIHALRRANLTVLLEDTYGIELPPAMSIPDVENHGFAIVASNMANTTYSWVHPESASESTPFTTEVQCIRDAERAIEAANSSGVDMREADAPHTDRLYLIPAWSLTPSSVQVDWVKLRVNAQLRRQLMIGATKFAGRGGLVELPSQALEWSFPFHESELCNQFIFLNHDGRIHLRAEVPDMNTIIVSTQLDLDDLLEHKTGEPGHCIPLGCKPYPSEEAIQLIEAYFYSRPNESQQAWLKAESERLGFAVADLAPATS